MHNIEIIFWRSIPAAFWIFINANSPLKVKWWITKLHIEEFTWKDPVLQVYLFPASYQKLKEATWGSTKDWRGKSIQTYLSEKVGVRHFFIVKAKTLA